MTDLYKTDYTAWLSQQRELLAQRQFHKLDIDNLLEAMDYEMGSTRDTLESHLSVLVLHLLKYDYQKRILKDLWVEDKVVQTWMPSIYNSRAAIEKQISKHPHLQPTIEELLAGAYSDACRQAVKQMNNYARSESQKLSKNSFPDQCPWTFEQITDDDWLPGD
ncbi:DUF29 domain-containing protein [Endozoicomonas sp. 8E]|uniref:DUF29 domain-containing protein n=1 Tax=Endozoicomonas sp. 8E TaxID=3035692 RepID=UPI0029392401|nr:DUF29 domain-containing protein [Endozoicomonas sp. 8E]WOG27426.1 DUF29 domain-containing protein [Endozoicomonas sp. 8E]